MKECLKQYTLAQIETMAKDGRISMEDVYRYVDGLNDAPNDTTEYYFHHKTGTIRKLRISDTL